MIFTNISNTNPITVHYQILCTQDSSQSVIRTFDINFCLINTLFQTKFLEQEIVWKRLILTSALKKQNNNERMNP